METISGIFSESFWWAAPILVTMTTALTGLINQGLKIKKSWLKQVISWVIGTGFSVAAWAIKIVTFGTPVWLGVCCLCIVVGLSANGFYDISVIKNWINSWFRKTVTTVPEDIGEIDAYDYGAYVGDDNVPDYGEYYDDNYNEEETSNEKSTGVTISFGVSVEGMKEQK